MRIARAFISFFAFLVSGTSFSERSFDILTCKRERPKTRQFCAVNDQRHKLGTHFKSADPGTLFHSLQTKQLSLRGRSSDIQVRLDGFFPEIKFVSQWNRDLECAVNSLWDHRIGIFAARFHGDRLLADLSRRPAQGYGITLREQGSYQIKKVSDGVAIEASVFFRDLDWNPNQPLAVQRIPKSCTIQISDFYLGFDSEELAKNLEVLEGYADFSTKMLTKAFLLHNQLLNHERSQYCAVLRLGKVLRRVEGLAEGDPWGDLSRGAKIALRQAMTELSLPQSDQDLFALFATTNFQADLTLRCGKRPADADNKTLESIEIRSSEYTVDGNRTDPALYNNARDFEREQDNLKRIIGTARSAATLAGLELELLPDLSWILNPFVRLLDWE